MGEVKERCNRCKTQFSRLTLKEITHNEEGELIFRVKGMEWRKVNLLFSTRIMSNVLSSVMSSHCQNGRVSGRL